MLRPVGDIFFWNVQKAKDRKGKRWFPQEGSKIVRWTMVSVEPLSSVENATDDGIT
jgi:hypothetical protein